MKDATTLGVKGILGLGVTWIAASFSAYLGIIIYAFTFGPHASMNIVRDRVAGVGFCVIALLLDVAAAWKLGFANRPFTYWTRCGLSLGANLIGAAIFYAAIWRSLWPLFNT